MSKDICRVIALNTILTRQYAIVNILYTYYRIKTNVAVVPHVKGVEVVYYKIVYSALLINTYMGWAEAKG